VVALLAIVVVGLLVVLVLVARAAARGSRRPPTPQELPVEQLLRMQHEMLAAERRRGTEELRGTQTAIDHQVNAMREELARLNRLVEETERDRREHVGELTSQLQAAGRQTQVLTDTTQSLREALSSTTARGGAGATARGAAANSTPLITRASATRREVRFTSRDAPASRSRTHPVAALGGPTGGTIGKPRSSASAAAPVHSATAPAACSTPPVHGPGPSAAAASAMSAAGNSTQAVQGIATRFDTNANGAARPKCSAATGAVTAITLALARSNDSR